LLLKEGDRLRIKQIKEEILRWMKSFQPVELVSTDICEI
jgi:predicted DNA-binding antitoxin AbrB/MazE fold protein